MACEQFHQPPEHCRALYFRLIGCWLAVLLSLALVHRWAILQQSTTCVPSCIDIDVVMHNRGLNTALVHAHDCMLMFASKPLRSVLDRGAAVLHVRACCNRQRVLARESCVIHVFLAYFHLAQPLFVRGWHINNILLRCERLCRLLRSRRSTTRRRWAAQFPRWALAVTRILLLTKRYVALVLPAVRSCLSSCSAFVWHAGSSACSRCHSAVLVDTEVHGQNINLRNRMYAHKPYKPAGATRTHRHHTRGTTRTSAAGQTHQFPPSSISPHKPQPAARWHALPRPSPLHLYPESYTRHHAFSMLIADHFRARRCFWSRHSVGSRHGVHSDCVWLR